MGRVSTAVRSALASWSARRRAGSAARRNRDRGTHCFYCGVAFEGAGNRARTVDHRLARSRGGTDGLVNLVFACRACNQHKADRPDREFVESEWLRRRRRALGASARTDQSGATSGTSVMFTRDPSRADRS